MRKLSGLMALGLCSFVTLSLAACGNSRYNAIPTLMTTTDVKQGTVAVKKGNIKKIFSISGKVVPVMPINFSFGETDGYLAKLNIKAGDVIKSGDIIAELDAEDIKYQIQQEQIKVQMAQLDYDEAVSSKATKFNVERAELNLESENLNMNKLKESLNNTVLRADTSGIVTSVEDLKLYQHIEPYEILGTMADPSNCEIQFDGVNDKLIAGRDVEINEEGQNIVVDGKVVSNVIKDGKSGKEGAVIFKFNNRPQNVKFGDIVDIRYIDSQANNTLLLPVDAVKAGAGNHPYVRIISKSGNITEKYVETGISDGENIQIVSGLSIGDEVISN